MATLSQMMVVACVLGTSTDFLVVARGVVLPDVFSQDAGGFGSKASGPLYRQYRHDCF